MRKFGFSWSWKRATGLSSAKGKLSRAIGIPLTRSGRERKIGRVVGILGLGLLGLTRGSGQAAQPTVSGGQQTCGDCGHVWTPRGGKLYSPRCPNCGKSFTNITIQNTGSGCGGCIAVCVVFGVMFAVCAGVLSLSRKTGPQPQPTTQPSPQTRAEAKSPSAKNNALEPTPKPLDEVPLQSKSENKPEPVATRKQDPPRPTEQKPPEPAHTTSGRELRTWHDSSGSFSSTARLKSVANGKVHLVKEDGSEIIVPMERLSDDDKTYIRKQMH